MSKSPIVNLLTGRREFLLVRNDPGPLMRRLLGMSTLRVCVGCYDDTFKSYPQQLQKAEATGEPSGDRHLTNLVAAQKARGLRT